MTATMTIRHFGDIPMMSGWRYPDAKLTEIEYYENTNITVLDTIVRDNRDLFGKVRNYNTVAFCPKNSDTPMVFNTSGRELVGQITYARNQGCLPLEGKLMRRECMSGRSYWFLAAPDPS
jgi:hypothetical protein